MFKAGIKELLDSADVQDPTDFPPPSTAPGLRALDSALRCNICQELYEAPVVLSCGHCFCSLCARSQLGEKAACPTCWKESTISSFRVNPAMEEAVTAWKEARPFVLRVVNETLNAQIAASDSSRPSKRRKPNSHSGDVFSSPSAYERRSGQSGAPAPANFNADTSSDEVEQAMRSGSEPPTSNSSIECPVCAKSVPMRRINEHLDSNCRSYLSSTKTASSSTSGQKDAWSKLLGGKKSGKEREKLNAEADTPIPKVSYSVLKDRQIRDLLAAHELSTVGDRSQLIARHERWVAVYNANLDRSPTLRKRQADLQAELRRWEEDRRVLKKEPLKTDIAEYRRANKAEFDKLVQLARPKPSRHGKSPKRGGEDEASGDLDHRRLKGPGVSDDSEMEAINVDSEPDG